MMRISDCSSDVCSSDLLGDHVVDHQQFKKRQSSMIAGAAALMAARGAIESRCRFAVRQPGRPKRFRRRRIRLAAIGAQPADEALGKDGLDRRGQEKGFDLHVEKPGNGARRSRSEEHTSELQSLMRISYAVFCL